MIIFFDDSYHKAENQNNMINTSNLVYNFFREITVC